MVRSIIFVSAVVAALATAVSAVPMPATLVGIDGGDHIGTGDIFAEGAVTDVVNANNLHIEDAVQNVGVVDDDYDMNFDFNRRPGSAGGLRRPETGAGGRPVYRPEELDPAHTCHDGCHHHGGLLSGLLKREEPAASVRISKTAGMKGNKMMAKKAAAKKAAPAKQ